MRENIRRICLRPAQRNPCQRPMRSLHDETLLLAGFGILLTDAALAVFVGGVFVLFLFESIMTPSRFREGFFFNIREASPSRARKNKNDIWINSSDKSVLTFCIQNIIMKMSNKENDNCEAKHRTKIKGEKT